MKITRQRLILIAAILTSAVVTAEEIPSQTLKPAPAMEKPEINEYKMVIPMPVNPAPVRVAVYCGPGAPSDSAEFIKERVDSIAGSTVKILTAEQVGAVDLKAFDVMCFPGGSAGAQAKAVGETGLNNVREYVRGGGGYVGICAGAYLACNGSPTNRLSLLNAVTVSPKWERGRGWLEEELTTAGHGLLGDVSGTFKVNYHNGPVIKPADNPEMEPYTALSLFRTEVAENGAPAGVQVNSPAQAIGNFGKGRVFISSPHPEKTPGLENLIPRGVLWAAGKSGGPAPSQ